MNPINYLERSTFGMGIFEGKKEATKEVVGSILLARVVVHLVLAVGEGAGGKVWFSTGGERETTKGEGKRED